MFEPVVNGRDVAARSPVVRPPDRVVDQLRLTLAAIIGAAIDGVLPADGGFARAGLRRDIAAYAAGRRAAGVQAEHMLVELKKLVLEPASRPDVSERRRVTEDLIAWAIEAYYGGAESAADVGARPLEAAMVGAAESVPVAGDPAVQSVGKSAHERNVKGPRDPSAAR
jgi:hypothetical protein